MSEKLLDINGITVFRYVGNANERICYQINGLNGECVQLTISETAHVIQALLKDIINRYKEHYKR